MNILKTGSPTIIIKCQRHFTFLPIIQQLTFRGAIFLQCFIVSKNVVCSLFTKRATIIYYLLCYYEIVHEAHKKKNKLNSHAGLQVSANV